MTKDTNPENLRTKLSEFFDKALQNPVSIARGDDRFILMNEEEYFDLKDEVLSLRRNLFSMLQVADGKAKSFNSTEEGMSELFDKLSKKKAKD